jgi:hypothetical protein
MISEEEQVGPVQQPNQELEGSELQVPPEVQERGKAGGGVS